VLRLRRLLRGRPGVRREARPALAGEVGTMGGCAGPPS
jgi:hypothetical protein